MKLMEYFIGFFVGWYAVVKSTFEVEKDEKGYIGLPFPFATIGMFFIYPFVFLFKRVQIKRVPDEAREDV